MLPGVDLPEVILEVMAGLPAFAEAFTAVSGGNTRLADLHVSIAALPTAHALNVGLKPVLADLPALTRDRLAHVDQHYLRPENYAAANAVLIDAQAAIPLAQLWGGGLVAAVDGMRFVVPVRTAHARANPKYFARKRGVTWLNMISDQAVGLTGRVLSGAPRDTLNVVDLLYNPDGGPRPEVLITDAGSYSDVVCGIVTLLGFDYRPVLADLPDAKLWRVDAAADYGVLDKAARGRVDPDKIRRHWPDILRMIASVHPREISAHDVIRVLQHDGRRTSRCWASARPRFPHCVTSQRPAPSRCGPTRWMRDPRPCKMWPAMPGTATMSAAKHWCWYARTTMSACTPQPTTRTPFSTTSRDRCDDQLRLPRSRVRPAPRADRVTRSCRDRHRLVTAPASHERPFPGRRT
jgi:hypothetical protein